MPESLILRFFINALIMQLNLEDLREEYRRASLNISEVASHPNVQFRKWFEEAQKSQIIEPNAMILSTSTRDGKPSARTVLLKGFDEKGFVFYTNYNSRKGKELATNPWGSLLFLWMPLQRQIRIEGKVVKLDPEISTKYFQSRPKGSQIGAYASPQSEVIADRFVLEEEEKRLEEKYRDQDQLPRPDYWGGYVVQADLFEFWQGRPNRLHDRIQYTRNGEKWIIERLAP